MQPQKIAHVPIVWLRVKVQMTNPTTFTQANAIDAFTVPRAYSKEEITTCQVRFRQGHETKGQRIGVVPVYACGEIGSICTQPITIHFPGRFITKSAAQFNLRPILGFENGVVLLKRRPSLFFFPTMRTGAFGKRRCSSVAFLAFFPTVASVVFSSSFLVLV